MTNCNLCNQIDFHADNCADRGTSNALSPPRFGSLFGEGSENAETSNTCGNGVIEQCTQCGEPDATPREEYAQALCDEHYDEAVSLELERLRGDYEEPASRATPQVIDVAVDATGSGVRPSPCA